MRKQLEKYLLLINFSKFDLQFFQFHLLRVYFFLCTFLPLFFISENIPQIFKKTHKFLITGHKTNSYVHILLSLRISVTGNPLLKIVALCSSLCGVDYRVYT